MLPLHVSRGPFEDVLTIFWWDTFEFIYSMDKSVKLVEGTLTNDELVVWVTYDIGRDVDCNSTELVENSVACTR